jgi:TPR repeat protein
MDGKLKIGLGILAVLAALYVFPFFVPLPERTTEAIIPPFPAEYGAAAIADLEAAETLYREGDLQAAYDLWKPLADAGNPEAQFRIGRLYDRGELFDRSLESARMYYRRSAMKNHPLAINNIVSKHKSSICDEPIIKDIFRAAVLGEYISQYNLGVLFYKGKCGLSSLHLSVQNFVRSARQNFSPSHDFLVRIYLDKSTEFHNPTAATFHLYASAEDRDAVFPFVFYLWLISATERDEKAARIRYLSWQPRHEVREP